MLGFLYVIGIVMGLYLVTIWAGFVLFIAPFPNPMNTTATNILYHMIGGTICIVVLPPVLVLVVSLGLCWLTDRIAGDRECRRVWRYLFAHAHTPRVLRRWSFYR